MLDIARVEVERHLLAALDQRVHAREQLIERTVQLADVPEREAAQEAAECGRVGQAMPAQGRLRLISAQQRKIVEALAARDQRLAEGEHRLRGAVAALALLDRDRVDQLGGADVPPSRSFGRASLGAGGGLRRPFQAGCSRALEQDDVVSVQE